MQTSEYKVKYKGSVVWLIVWTIVFFPIALMLFFTGAYFRSNGTSYRLRYEGSRFWLGFWLLVFFPVAFILLFCNGCAWVTEQDDTIIIT